VNTGAKARFNCFGPRILFTTLPLLAACTFIGMDNPALRRSMDWGAEQKVQTCVYLDEGVTRNDAEQLFGWWNEREANWYKLEFVPASYEPLKRDRNEFFYLQLSSKLQAVSRPDRCTKQIWLVSRNIADFIYGGAANIVGLPEVVGWTDDDTRSKAWVYANVTPDLNQLVMSPGAAIRHEMYHLLGCDHFDLDMSACYQAIQNSKAEQREYASHRVIDIARAQPGSASKAGSGLNR